MNLAQWKTILVTVDSEDVAAGISQQAQIDSTDVRVLIELDTGGKRTGVQSPEAALELGKLVMELPGLSLQGIMTYPSHVRAKPFIQQTVESFLNAGLPCPIISGGGTGGEAVSKEIGCTETRSGSYVYEGMTRVRGNADLSPERCALKVVVTVVSVPTQDRVIMDGGQKTFRASPSDPYGLVIEQPKARIYGMSVEHGHVDVRECDHEFRVGEKLSVIPRHQGMVTNMHDQVIGARNGQAEVVWQVQGRGKVK
jgi:D-serine deaminase-like pyridoxal phosphate-dependent protein